MPGSIPFTSLSTQQILSYAKPTKEYEAIMSMWPPMRMDWSDHQSAIAKLRTQTEFADEMDEPDPAVQENLEKFNARDGFHLSLRVFRSQSSGISGPLVLLYHGGGWCLGSTTMVADIARKVVKELKAVVVAPQYRLAPENVWPKSIDDGWDAFEYMRQHHEEFEGVDVKKGFVIGGISAGASMSLVYAHRARDEGLEPKITGVWSSCGSARVRDEDFETLEEVYRERLLSRSQEACVKNPVLSPEMQKLLRECVKPDEKSQWFNGLVWGKGEKGKYGHHGLPKMYHQICGRDVSRDEALVLDDMLRKEGVDTRVDLYEGLPHCFWIALSHIPEFQRWERDTIESFRWLLRTAS